MGFFGRKKTKKTESGYSKNAIRSYTTNLFDTTVLEANLPVFYNNPVVRQCIDLIVSAVQRVPIVLYKDNELIEDSKELFNAGKLGEDSLVAFKNKLVRLFILYGNVKICVDRKSYDDCFIKASVVNEAEVKWDAYTFDEDGRVLFYKREGTNEGDKVPSYLKFKQEGVSRQKYNGWNFNFIGEWANVNFLGSAGSRNSYLKVLSTYVMTMKQLNDRANGLAKGAYNTRHIITTHDTMLHDEDGFEEKLLNSKKEDSVFVVNGVKLEVHTLDYQLSDIFDKISTDDIKRTIAGVFGVPIALISPSSADGAKYSSNYQESRVSFYEDTIIPRYLAPIEDFLSNTLFPSEYKLRFDLDKIDCIRDKRIQRYVDIGKISFLTDEEKRKLAEL